jgi:hypothetical protein
MAALAVENRRSGYPTLPVIRHCGNCSRNAAHYQYIAETGHKSLKPMQRFVFELFDDGPKALATPCAAFRSAGTDRDNGARVLFLSTSAAATTAAQAPLASH